MPLAGGWWGRVEAPLCARPTDEHGGRRQLSMST